VLADGLNRHHSTKHLLPGSEHHTLGAPAATSDGVPDMSMCFVGQTKFRAALGLEGGRAGQRFSPHLLKAEELDASNGAVGVVYV